MSCTDLKITEEKKKKKITESWIKTPVTLATLFLCFSGFSPSLIVWRLEVIYPTQLEHQRP